EKEKLREGIIRIYKRIEVESRKYSSARASKESLFSNPDFYKNGRHETASPQKIIGIVILALILVASSLFVPKILPSVLKFRLGITGHAFVCTGEICFSPEPENINTYQDNETIIYVHVTNPENHTSINFTTTVDNPLFTIVEKINTTSAKINFTPINSQVGDHVVTIAVRNSNGDIEDLKQPTYTVINVNDPPNITNWSPQEENPKVSENYTIGFLFNYTASDPDIPYGDSLTSYWYLDANLNSTNATNISYFPGFCSAGYHNVTVVVQDILGLTDEHYWNANVTNLNRIPVLNSTISNYPWNEDSSIASAFDLDEKFYDLDNRECSGENKDNITFTSALASGGTPSIIITISQESHEVFLSSSQNWCGNESVVFYANDSYEKVVSNNVTLSVNCTPDSPVLSPIGSITTRTAVNFVLNVNASDADITYGDYLSFSINDTSLFNITTTNPTSANAVINFTPDISDVGVYYFNISVMDSSGREDYEFVELTISYNNPPILEAISNQSLSENYAFIMQINATDADGDNITYSAESSNSFPSLSISNFGLMNFSFEQADVGNHSVTVTAADSWGAINSSTFNFEVKNINQPPVISNIGNKRAKIEHQFTLLVNATDQDIVYGDSLEFALNDTTLFNLSAINSSSAMISFTPSEIQIGTYYLMINATDLAGESSNTSFELIIDTNSAPSIGISAMNNTENEHFTLDMNAYTTDLDYDPITFGYNFVNESNSTFPHFSMTSYGLIEFTSNKSDVGEHFINLSAYDGENTTSRIVNFTVFAVDNFPILGSIGNLSATEGSLFTVQLNATDIENDTLEFVYSIINGSSFPGFNISSSGLINFTPAAADVGNRTINITVRQTDNNSISDSEVITFAVYHFNHAPNITSYAPSNGNFQMYENSTIIFNHTSSDSDNDTLHFQWLLDSVLQNESANWSYSPDFDSAGLRNITLIVNDTFSAVSQSWNVTVVNVNRAPAYGIFSESSAGFLNGTENSANASSGIRLAKNSSTTYYRSGFF
ncbi:MAG: Ig-like domain-containing protein, partial [Candidatus Woesearchaeota archaeon]|nr:Ig-like domain-containing protein [Candidatus Woesearchaeota archaeon]